MKPDFALAYCNRGLSEVELGRYDDAIADYAIAIGQDPELTYCYFNRANLYLLLGEYQRAISDYTTALGKYPSDVSALSRRGEAYEAIGQNKQALDDYNAALAINPSIESAKEGLLRLRRVVFRFHLDDGRVVDSAKNELPETSQLADECIFIDFCEADLYL